MNVYVGYFQILWSPVWEGGTVENSGQHSHCINFGPDKPCAKFRTAIEELIYPWKQSLNQGKTRK